MTAKNAAPSYEDLTDDLEAAKVAVRKSPTEKAIASLDAAKAAINAHRLEQRTTTTDASASAADGAAAPKTVRATTKGG